MGLTEGLLQNKQINIKYTEQREESCVFGAEVFGNSLDYKLDVLEGIEFQTGEP